MKFRQDFVTNSSSSSFIVMKSEATERELNIIKNYIDSKYNEDSWRIKEYPDAIHGFTWMDNYTIWEYMKEHDVRREIFDVEWD